jgi:hypothetical protein
MATGDTTISIAIEGGVTKSVVLDSATRVLSRAAVTASDAGNDTDVEWQVLMVNKLGNVILAQANSKAQASASWSPKTFTAAT